jgi:Ran GTPase-activating protein (RanGAP) involved in mRNA processing and transport
LPTNFKFNQMKQNVINDIEVKDFIDVTLQSLNAIDDAKKLLKEHGYFVDNLWQTEDVTMNHECTEEEAQTILYSALTNDATYQQIWEAISYEAENMNLKRRD